MKHLTTAMVFLGMGMTAQAADPYPAPQPVPAQEPAAPSFSITGYGWATALTGRASTVPPLPAVKVDESFGDILKDLNGAVMAMAELRVGRWGFIADAMFSEVTSKTRLPGPYFSVAKLRSQTFTAQASVLYRIYEDDRLSFDVGPGLRFWNLDTRLTIEPGALNLALTRAVSEAWVDPVVGARVIARLSGPWSLTLLGDIGGFDVGSRLSWQALGTVNYEWNEDWVLHAGYRALRVDYKDDRFLYRTTMHGPLMAVTYRF